MALNLAVRMEATIMDEQNVQADTSVYAMVDPTASFATILAELNAWLVDLDACSDGQIIETTLQVLPSLPEGLKGAPVALSRVEQTGMIGFKAAGDTHQWATPIPALSNDPTVISGGKVVTTAGSPVQILAALLAGGGTATLVWSNAVGQTLTQATSSLISFRQYNFQLARQTYEV